MTEKDHLVYNLWDAIVTVALKQIEEVLKSEKTNSEKFNEIDSIVQRTVNPY